MPARCDLCEGLNLGTDHRKPSCRLREVAARAGWPVVATYDETSSGAASVKTGAPILCHVKGCWIGGNLTFF